VTVSAMKLKEEGSSIAGLRCFEGERERQQREEGTCFLMIIRALICRMSYLFYRRLLYRYQPFRRSSWHRQAP
jgi:hypothetical protein